MVTKQKSRGIAITWKPEKQTSDDNKIKCKYWTNIDMVKNNNTWLIWKPKTQLLHKHDKW